MKMLRPALLLGLTLALLMPTQAFAAHTSHVDATGDVVAYTAESDFEEAEPAPEQRNGDIRGFYYTHGKNAVIVTIRFVELTRDEGVATMVRLNTNVGRRDVIHLSDIGAFMNTPRRGAKCQVRATPSYANNRVKLVIPRKCLGNPRWVRAGAGVLTGLYTDEDQPIFSDEAYRNGSVTQSNQIRLGGRVLRG